MTAPGNLAAWLRARDIGRGDPVGLAIAPDGALACALPSGEAFHQPPVSPPTAGETIHERPTPAPGETNREGPAWVLGATIHEAEREVGPRWVWWGPSEARALAAAGVPVGRCWDVAAVHRHLTGRWHSEPAQVWAYLHGLDDEALPRLGQLDLLAPAAETGDPDDPVQPDGYLRPAWAAGGWAASPDRLARWAALALDAAHRQEESIGDGPGPARTRSTVHAESAAAMLCAELEHDGLPIDLDAAERIIAAAVGPRPTDPADDERLRAQRDDAVLVHAPPGRRPDLRNPAEVRALLRRIGVEVTDTRAWRLEQHRDDHPLVEALLRWRKAERIATTYGYRWLDEHVLPVPGLPGRGRLRGEWTNSDGAAGRMTASAGLHNLPAELRPAVTAEPGYAFVHADLGQIEPRVWAAVSGDPALVAATAADDLYEQVAARLGVDRGTAKVGVLGAMYGGTTGNSGLALARLRQEYPVGMAVLEDAAERGRRAEPVHTIGGRSIRMWDAGDAAARGRYARNALIQGAAAEFFKLWTVTFRARATAAGLDARIVLCLHDEVLIHAAEATAAATGALLAEALREAAARWSPVPAVRFTASVSVVARWSDAK